MKYIVHIALLLFSIGSWAQGFGTFGGGTAQTEEVKDPTSWSYSLSETDLNVGDEIDVFYEVSLEDKWVIYGTGIKDGPLPTEFTFEKNSSFCQCHTIFGTGCW